MNYAEQRYYGSTGGRFLSADPYVASAGAGAPQSWNRYVYVEGDPVNWHDPGGLMKQCPKGDGCKGETPQVALPGGSGSGNDNFLPDDGLVTGEEIGVGVGIGPSLDLQTLRAANGSVKFDLLITDPEDAKVKVMQRALNNVISGVRNDSGCVKFLGSGKWGQGVGNANIVMQFLEATTVGVARQFFEDGKPTSSVGAVANVQETVGVDILFNGAGGFYYGGVPLSHSNTHTFGSLSRAQLQAFAMLHELSHVARASAFANSDGGSEKLQKDNNDLLWSNCSRTILGAR